MRFDGWLKCVVKEGFTASRGMALMRHEMQLKCIVMDDFRAS